jgi:hypothetical protein
MAPTSTPLFQPPASPQQRPQPLPPQVAFRQGRAPLVCGQELRTVSLELDMRVVLAFAPRARGGIPFWIRW